MKKCLFFLLLFFAVNATPLIAGGGIYEYFIQVAGIFYGTNNTTLNGATFATGIDLNSSTLTINNRGINTWNDSGCDVTGANINYRVYLASSTPPSFISSSLPYQGMSGNNKFWNTSTPAINLLAGLTQAGTYTVEIFFDAPTNSSGGCDPILYESNGGGNFFASFVVDTALPVSNGPLDIRQHDREVTLSWTTTSEHNNQRFDIEHSLDGKTFDRVGSIAGQGNTTFPTNYTFSHAVASAGLHYFRWKQVDFDGTYSYSDIKSIRVKNNELVIFPNPTNGIIRVNSDIDDDTKVLISSKEGQQVLAIDIIQNNQIDISNLANGVYFMTIINDKVSEVHKIIKY